MFAAIKGLFRKKSRQESNYEILRARIGRNQQTVYEAVCAIGIPCNGRMVARHLGWDSASVTNRLCELTRKDRLVVAYRKKGLDGLTRNYYQAARHD